MNRVSPVPVIVSADTLKLEDYRLQAMFFVDGR
jgi:hypothetical protein